MSRSQAHDNLRSRDKFYLVFQLLDGMRCPESLIHADIAKGGELFERICERGSALQMSSNMHIGS